MQYFGTLLHVGDKKNVFWELQIQKPYGTYGTPDGRPSVLYTATILLCGFVAGVLLTTAVVALSSSGRLRKKEPLPWKTIPPPPSDLSDPSACVERNCSVAASVVMSLMNRDVDPCKDFYGFVCGNYGQRRGGQLLGTMAIEMQRNAQSMLRQAHVPARDQTAVQKAAGYYQSCLKVEENERDSVASLQKFLKTINVSIFENRPGNAFDSVIMLALKYKINVILEFSMHDLAVSKGRRLLEIALNFEDVALSRKIRRQMKKEEDILRFYLRHLEAYGREGMNLVRDVIEVEKKALSLLFRGHLSMFQRSDLLQLNKLDRFTPHLAPQKWASLIAKHSKGVYGPKYTAAYRPAALVYFDKLHSELGDAGVSRLTAWLLLRQLAPLTMSEVRDIYGGSSVASSCFSQVVNVMELPALAIYLFKVFPLKTQGVSRNMVNNIRASIIGEIGSSTWMEHQSKIIAQSKVRVMGEQVGYPSNLSTDAVLTAWYRAYPQAEKIFFKSWQLAAELEAKRLLGNATAFPYFSVSQVNAYYLTEWNVMIIPAGIVRPPLFIHSGPASFNYGGLGHIVSHEIMHAFDVDGSKRDETGKKKDWWTDKTYRRYVEKALCLRRSHQEFARSRNLVELNSTLDSENMADFLGLMSAYAAFTSLDDERAFAELPFDARQLFFIASCVKWCAVHTYELDSRYASLEARCNVPLMHLKEFAQAFRCVPGDPMYLKKRCTFW